ncbi:hypothetical protein [Geoalkalibacter halelectricus]|uniref:Uncharacterized protein n=1 Tax=Geoalkalibacter halelectricus TaxID=2847045 RepID=A0ABY5ZL02_9BACT|nr:hypothetical protein [Geoalkalibacter halelectricus]MDO3378854.1 hypothetical protein [Geoalkalibacter halelectricus]UWZ79842.1 hypothetical protein L9S41_00235 [Geoalkalibacter halelectricus]
MKTLQWILIALLTCAGQALAGPVAPQVQSGWLIWIFCAFGALILVAQLIPGMVLLGSMLRGLYRPSPGSRESSPS